MQEIWKPVPLKDYSDLYQVSNLGKVKSLNEGIGKSKKEQNSNHLLNLSNHSWGYDYVTFSKNNVRKNMFVHRLVALAFIPNPQNYPVINHKDGNKKNNCVDNLEWCTQKENMQHASKMGLLNKNHKLPKKRIKSVCFKKAKPVYQFSMDGKLINIWRSGMEASKELSIPNNKIYMCCNGKISYSNGFIWSYSNSVNPIQKTPKPKNGCGKKKQNKSNRIRKCCPINQYDLDGNYIKTFKNGLSASKETGISQTGICLCCKGKRPHSNGYIWKYADA